MAVQAHPQSVRTEQGQGSPHSSSRQDEESSAWWSSWLASAKEKSMTALSATKRDLAEFVTVLSSDTKAAVSGASANIKEILGQPDSGEQTDGSSEGSPSISQKKGKTVETASAPYDRCQAELFAVQNSKETYLVDPEDKVYAEWKSKFDVQACQSEISTILVCCSHVRTLHSQLVPAQVSYEAFWMRYFFKIQQLQKEEKRRADLMERATKRAEEQLQWDELEEINVSELPSPLHKPEGGHQRSESSSDSFVCISEATSNNDTHIDRAPSQDPDTWVYLGSENGHGSQHSPHDKEEEGGTAELVNEVENLALSDDLEEETLVVSDGGEVGVKQEEDTEKRKDGGGGGGEGGDSGSDWENWDD